MQANGIKWAAPQALVHAAMTADQLALMSVVVIALLLSAAMLVAARR